MNTVLAEMSYSIIIGRISPDPPGWLPGPGPTQEPVERGDARVAGVWPEAGSGGSDWARACARRCRRVVRVGGLRMRAPRGLKGGGGPSGPVGPSAG